jgi:hypothetical protein
MYFFSPPGENERLMKQSGLKQIEARDTTDCAALLSKRWHDAREKRKAALVASEGEANFAGVQVSGVRPYPDRGETPASVSIYRNKIGSWIICTARALHWTEWLTIGFLCFAAMNYEG